jgi:hypothetical protein
MLKISVLCGGVAVPQPLPKNNYMNIEYFVASSSGAQTGPYTLEQLNELGITAGTLVWCEGMPTWAKAGEVPHLQQYFKKATPPPLPRTEPPPTRTYGGLNNNQSLPQTTIHEYKINPLQKWIYILIIIIILMIIIFAFVVSILNQQINDLNDLVMFHLRARGLM